MDTTTVVNTFDNSVATFSVIDYCVFGSLFLISALIGIGFAIKDRNKQSSENYLLAGRSMSGWPVALSLTASFISAITVLGTPAEVYVYGAMFYWFFLSYTVAALLTSQVFMPVFYKMGLSSTYEYLEARFNRTVRLAGNIAFIFQTVLYMGMVMYMPALALNKVTGLSLIMSIVGTSLVCIFYTTIGGMKAVVWNDVVQCIVMCVGFVAIVIKGCSRVGGIDEVFRIAKDHGRLELDTVDFDPRVRHTIWSICIGGSFTWLTVYAINQSMVQRYLSCKSLKEAKISLYINDVGLLVVITLACLTGLVMFAVYQTCDPLSSGKVSKSDQLTPYLVMDIFRDAPGFPGVFVAAAYSGTLSTVSTGINALSCSTYEDFIKPKWPRLSVETVVLINKALVVVFGLLGLAVAFGASLMDKILTLALKMFGIIGGPVLGMFCLGLFTPLGNSMGAFVGLIVGLITGMWLGVGSYMCPPSVEFTRALNFSTEGCYNSSSFTTPAYNYSISTPTVITESINCNEYGLGNSLYSLSYCHYSTLLVSVTWIVGILVSICTGGLKTRNHVPSHLLVCSGDWCCCFGRNRGSMKSASFKYIDGKARLEKNSLILEDVEP